MESVDGTERSVLGNPGSLDAIIVVPPHLRYVAGPLLGPAMLKGAAKAAGLIVEVVDLAASRWRNSPRRVSATPPPPSPFIGDQDRSAGATDAWSADEEQSLELLLGPAPRTSNIYTRPAVAMPYDFAQATAAAMGLLRSPDGAWLRKELLAHPRPSVIGVSVLYAGQVVWALAITQWVRETWPGTLVIWGGPHVTALADLIARDAKYQVAADAFVIGHAEATFVQILRAVRDRQPLPAEAWTAGSGKALRARADASILPDFGNHAGYGPRLTLPVQTAIGCSYRKCTFCTYPLVEPMLWNLDLKVVDHVLALALSAGAVIAVKDSLVPPDRLRAIGRRICGRTEWSACTKLHRAFTPALFRELRDAGCHTLELGVETLVARSQLLIEKQQPRDLVLRVLDAASAGGVSIVANYITGFPDESVVEAAEALGWLQAKIHERAPDLVARIEHHRFELDRLAPLATAKRPPGLRVIGEWPYSSILDWTL